MKVDLAKDQQKIRRYILQRIKDYPVYINIGPGEDEDPIQLITLGYYLEQTGYFALVFDTRTNADNDGQWTLHIEDPTMLHFPKWCSLLERWYEGETSELVLPDGTSCQINQESHTHESIAQIVGEMLRDTMIRLRDEGALQDLPLGKDAFLIVEEFDGHWGWPKTYKTRKQVQLNREASQDCPEAIDEETDDDRKEALVKRIRKLPVDEQISFWTSELDCRARGRPSELGKVFADPDFLIWGNDCALGELERIGKQSVVPLLELVRNLARLSEWSGDRPKRNVSERPMQGIAVGAIWKVGDLGHATENVEKLLHQIIRTACKTNAKRSHWGILPYHAALCLQTLFPGYPKPAWEPKTNRLKRPELFQSRPLG